MPTGPPIHRSACDDRGRERERERGRTRDIRQRCVYPGRKEGSHGVANNSPLAVLRRWSSVDQRPIFSSTTTRVPGSGAALNDKTAEQASVRRADVRDELTV